MNDHVDSNKKADNLFEISLRSFDRYLNVNVLSLFSVCREFARNNNRGTIVNFSSTYGITSPMPNLYPGKNEKHIGYGVSKAAVIQLTRHLAIHLAPNFTVNCVAPGGVKHKQDKNFIEKYSNKTPMGRMMNIEEVPSVFDFLLDEKSSYVNGTEIVIDGGWTSW